MAITYRDVKGSPLSAAEVDENMRVLADTAAVIPDLASSAGSLNMGHIAEGANAVPRTAQSKARDIVSLADCMTAAELADVRARTRVLDVSAAINSAVLDHPNAIIWAGHGTYKKTTSTTLGAAQQIKGAGQANTIFHCDDAFDAFDLASSYAGVSDCGFTSTAARTSGKYIKLSAATRGNFVRSVLIENAFIGISIEAEAVINYFQDIEIINTAPTVGIGIWINGGNDTFLSRVVMDAPVGSQPLCGIRMQRTQATWATDCDMIHQGRGIQIDPVAADGGLITWCFFSAVACDLGTGDGLYVNPDNATVKGLFFQNCWFSSNLNGVNITETGTGAVDSVFFNASTFFNNENRGAWLQSGSNVEWDGCRLAGNSNASSGTYAGIQIANGVVDFAIRGCRSGAIAGFTPSQSYGLLIGTGCDGYLIVSNGLTGNATGGALDNSAGTSLTREVFGNLGYKTMASGTAIILSGTNEISPTHNLAGAPSIVLANPSNVNLAGLSFWTGAFGATTFNINVSANVPGDTPFSWTASIYN